MKTFDQFFPDLMPNVPQCSEPAAELALLRAAQRFCSLTFAWRVTLEPMELIAGIDEYEIDFPDRSELVRIEDSKMNGRDIKAKMPNSDPPCREFIECDDGKTLIMNPVPQGAGTLLLKLTLKPSNRATGVEDFIFDQYVAEIAKGAEGILKQHAQKPYSTADGADVWKAFEARCATIKMKLWRGNARNNSRTAPIWF